MTTKGKEIVGIIVGGGPAPGINGVISSAAIEAINHGKKVLGIVGGFKALFEGDRKAFLELSIDDVSRIHSEGGSILRTSRDFPEKANDRFTVLVQTLKALGIRSLITIGGDGTLFMANWIQRETRGEIAVVHVPKTIDNDLLLPGGMPTFGYESARHWGVIVVNNLMKDAQTTGRWYFVTTMGRYAGHLALGIGKASGATITVIPEEFIEEKISFKKVADIIEGSIIKRLSMGKDHGVAILAEGISNKFDIEELSQYEDLSTDETGRIRLSDIQLGRLIKKIVQESLSRRGLNITIMDKTVGYELRSANPIPFDCEYTRNLGYGAVRFLLHGGSGAMITVTEGRIKTVPLAEMIDPLTGKARIRLVDTESEGYTVAREYMIRLEKRDLEKQPLLQKLSHAGKIPVAECRKRFSYLCRE